jgi:hypothetical protein
MTLSRLSVLVLAAVTLVTTPALAGSYQGGAGLPLDPQLLPANSGPGDCVTRRVTGPGGAYRWDRVECDPDHGWQDHGQWGYGRSGYQGRLDIETRGGSPPLAGGYDDQDDDHGSYTREFRGDRYGERREDRREDQYERAYDDGYEQGRGGPVVNYPPSYAYGYVAAGRDEAGYLIWPGKTP